MKFYFNPGVVVSGIGVLLNADATLQGSTYLNGTVKIFSGRAPNDASPPFLVVWALPFPQGPGSEFKGEVRIACYTSLLVNGQIDSKGDKILARCEELLSNGVISVTNMTVTIFSAGIIPSFLDVETDKSKAKGILRLRVSAGYNT